MATEKTYNGDGSDTTFDITFPYLTHADIGVSVGGQTKTVGSDYSITGDTVTFTTAPPSGTANVKLYRNTNIDTPEHEYTAGSAITAAKLNENQKQALYAIEEAKLVTTTSGGITTGNKNDITVNSDTDWVIRTDAVEQSMLADNSVGIDQIAPNSVNGDELVDNVVIPDANSIRFGTDSDMTIYHNGTSGVITNTTGDLYLWGNGSNNVDIRAKNDKHSIVCRPNAETELYHNGNEKFQTSSSGVTTTGTTHSTTGYTFGGTISYLYEGAANKPTLRIGADGPHLELSEPTTNTINIKNLNGDLKLENNVSITNGYLHLANGDLRPKSAPGDRFGVIPHVDSSGVMEVGNYIDFHKTDGNTGDYDLRVAPVNNAAGVTLLGMNWPGTSSYYHFITSSGLNINHINFVENGNQDYIQFHHLDTNNAAQVVGIYITVSDATLKENIVDSTYDALDCIKKLKLRDFDWKPEYKTGSIKCGLVAQEVETVNSSFVVDVKDGYKQLNTDRMVQVSLKAIQDLISKVETLEAKVAALEAQ